MNRTASFLMVVALVTAASCARPAIPGEVGLKELSENFECPPLEYGPYVWWHWLGPCFTLDGIDKDLHAMKEAGIAGATIFNVTSDVHEPFHGILDNPWPDHTFRSESYWEALEHAAQVAEELGLKLGLHNAPGYATTGGPWIDEKRGIQELVCSKTAIKGGGPVATVLPRPEYSVARGWGSNYERASLYTDVAVMAVPDDPQAGPESVLDISDNMAADGKLEWDAPQGRWTVVRIGQCPSMSAPHPLPEDLIGKTLEVDKMNRDASEYHWDNMLGPLKEHLGKYIGKSFTHILIDSYEADWQNWTYGFREEFVKDCGYDPIPFRALEFCGRNFQNYDCYAEDTRKVVNRLFFENGWNIAKTKVNEAGLQFNWEPYTGPFDPAAGTALADVPMGEFWTGGDGTILPEIVESARINHKRIVGAEAFTGLARNSGYTEDPAFLKETADGAFACGVNRLYLHHWTLQALDDCYKPGLSMGTWGTHFGRNQTWYEPGKAFFRYLARCQMLLQQGKLLKVGDECIHRATADAEIYFVKNSSAETVRRTVSCTDTGCRPELWDAYSGRIYDASPLSGNRDGALAVSVELKPMESMFVVFDKTDGDVRKAEEYYIPGNIETVDVKGSWNVAFKPATAEDTFEKKGFELSDFSTSDDARICYFAGTAVYSKTIDIASGTGNAGRVLLDLGEMNDIASIKINGQDAGVLWNPPYIGDITGFVKDGGNLLEIAVSVNWANRLIGDERYEADLEWHTKAEGEYPLTAFPDWFVNGTPRPSRERKTFANYTYYTPDSPLQKAGLEGPVRIIIE